jgi:zinc/manganese transport system substrate-binding protein
MRKYLITLISATVLWMAQNAQAQEKIPVVATFSILADIAKEVGGENVDVKSLVKAGDDAHVFSPSPADAKILSDAKVVLINGLGFEGWMNRLIKNSKTKAKVVTVSEGIKTIKTEEEVESGKNKNHKHNHHHDEVDPHAWQSVENVKIYVNNIAKAFSESDPSNASLYDANAKKYAEQLTLLNTEIEQSLKSIPFEKRKIITSHDAFGYFASRYKVEFIALQGLSTQSEATAKDVARIIQQIKKEKISAVFLENLSDSRLIKQIADETGAKIGGSLYSDSLSLTPEPAGTYLAMMRHNTKQIVDALK